MAQDNIRQLRGKKHLQKSADSLVSALPPANVNDSPAPASARLIDASIILDVIPYPVALWSPDHRSCIFNHPTRELLGSSEEDFSGNSSLWLERIHPQDRSDFLSAWAKLQAGEKKVSCTYRFLPKGQSTALRLSEISIFHSHSPRQSDVPGIWSLYTEKPTLEEGFTGPYSLRKLLHGLTHDISNNLQTISGELELSRWSGVLSAESAEAVSRGINRIRTLAHEIEEYLFPSTRRPRTEDPASLLTEVMQSKEKEMAAHGIRTGMIVKEALPKVPLDGQFDRALRDVIDFSRVLLPHGGELKIEAGMRRQEGERYIELNIVSSSATSLQVDEQDVFRPFSNVNGYRLGLSMAVAQQILKRHYGEIVFRKEDSNRGVFCLLIRAPESKKN
jgi:two-component sensor histidine kinase